MKATPLIMALAGGMAASMALAHSGVQNPAVMARMQAMGDIGDATKVLGQMVKGEADFDSDIVQAALQTIVQQAQRVPALFEAAEDDPKSEALPAIWDRFDDFTALSQDMATAASVDVTSMDDLRGAMAQIGGTCKACHTKYRE